MGRKDLDEKDAADVEVEVDDDFDVEVEFEFNVEFELEVDVEVLMGPPSGCIIIFVRLVV